MSSPNNRIRSASLEKYFYTPLILRDFDPRGSSVLQSTDVRHPTTNKYFDIGTFWLNPVDQHLFYLEAIINNLGRWVLVSGGAGGSITELEADDGNIASPDGLGHINLFGNIVLSGTHSKPLFSRADIANQLDLDLQVAMSVTPTPPDTEFVGVSCFNQDHFVVDATSGMVSLVGSSSDMNTLTADEATSPGVNPIVPDMSGNISVTAELVNSHAVPIETHTRNIHSISVEPQISSAVLTSTRLTNGMCHFDSDGFDIDTDGFVQLKGGGGTATTSVLTDSGAPAVEPDATGEIEILGGVGIDTVGTGPGNTVTINADGDVATQYNADSGSATPSGNLLNVIGSGGVTTSASGNTITITGSGGGFSCQQVDSDVNPMVANTKYVVDSASPVTLTLPTTTAVCDDFVVIRKGTGDVTIAQSAGQQVHFGGVSNTAGAAGSLDSNAQYDTIWISTITADLEFVVLNSVGSWTVN